MRLTGRRPLLAGVFGVCWFVDRTMAEIDQVLGVNLLVPVHLFRLVPDRRPDPLGTDA